MNQRSSLAFVCALLGACTNEPAHQSRATGSAVNGRTLLQAYECGVCHVIPGVPGARGTVGPSLAEFQRNVYVAGKYPNTVEYLVDWIIDPPALAPHTAMPAIGLSVGEARDIAAYLYTLE